MGIIVESLYLDSLKNDHSNVIVDRRSIIGSISFTGASVVDFISLVLCGVYKTIGNTE